MDGRLRHVAYPFRPAARRHHLTLPIGSYAKAAAMFRTVRQEGFSYETRFFQFPAVWVSPRCYGLTARDDGSKSGVPDGLTGSGAVTAVAVLGAAAECWLATVSGNPVAAGAVWGIA